MRACLRFFALGTLGALVAAGCSFTTGAGFSECSADAECGPTSACVRHYCLPLPQSCSRLDGAFDRGDRIPLATLVPLSADGGRNERELIRLEAMRLALSEANASGGLDHHPYGLFSCDVLPEDEVGVKALTEWLVENLEVPAIFSSGSSRTRWAADNDVRTDAGTFIMSANATSAVLVSIHANRGNVWRVAPPDTQQARVMRSLIVEADAGRSVSILYEEGDYGAGFKVALSAELQQAGFATALVGYSPPLSEKDATAAIGRLDGGSTSTTVVIGFPGDVALLAAAASKVPTLMPEAGHRWLLSDAAKAPAIFTPATKQVLEGALGTAPAQARGVAFHNFQQSFVSIYSVDPSDYSFTAHSYDAMWLTLAATAWASHGGRPITGRGMGEAMGHLAEGNVVSLLGSSWVDLALNLSNHISVNVEGSSGPLVFDVSAGAPSSDYEVWTVKNGDFSPAGFRTPR